MEPLPADHDSLLGRTIGHYRILEHVGSGGMGDVYRARDERLHRDVAVKILVRGLLADPSARKRFRAEALALSRVNHPSVETVFDFDRYDGLDVLVLEYVKGETLVDRLRRGPLPEKDIVRLGVQLAEGLSAVHAEGVLHRDLKPGNLRVADDGRLKILDFGLAQLMPHAAADAETESEITQAGRVAGTLRYMAPEQLRAEPLDGRTDVYAVGAVLYEMCTGRPAFRASSEMALAGDILHAPVSPPRASNPAISEDLERVILKALDKKASRRYQSGRELLVDLQRLEDTGGARPARPNRRHVRYAVLGAAGLAASAIVWWATTRQVTVPASFSARDWVLVADFANHTGRDALEQTVREALTLALQQSRYVNVLPRARVVAALGRMARPPDARVDDGIGLDLGRRENVAVVLVGTLTAAADQTEITVRGVAVLDGTTLFVEREGVTGDSQLQARVDALASRVRRDLGESLTQIRASRPLAEVTTRSTEALERYSRAADQISRGNFEEAGLSLRAAVALDLGFAMAHHLLARYYQRLGDSAREREHLERAWVLRDRLTDRERLVIEADYAALDGDDEAALEKLQTLVGLYPDDADARYELGVALSSSGKKVPAVGQLRQALRIDPHFLRARSTLVLILVEINENRDAFRVFEEGVSQGASTPDLEWGHALTLFGADHITRAREAFTALVERGEEPYRTYGDVYLERLAIYEARFAAARLALVNGVRADQQAGRGYPERLRRYLLARIALLEGNAGEARRQARAILGADRNARELRVEHLYDAGLLLVLGGDLEGASAALRRLVAMTEHPNGFARSCAMQLQGEIARAKGNLQEATESFERSAAAYPNYLAHQGLATVREALGERDEAIRAWEAVAAARGAVLKSGFPADWVLAHVRLATLYSSKGDSDRSRASCDRVRSALKNAERTAFLREALQQCVQPAGASR